MNAHQFSSVKAEIDRLTDAARPSDFNCDDTGMAPYARATAAVYARHGVTMAEYYAALTSGEHIVPAKL
jgi:hypothetical protein